MYEINGTGNQIWSLCDGERTAEAIQDEMKQLHPDVDPERLRSEVTEFLDQVTQLGLLDWVKPS